MNRGKHYERTKYQDPRYPGRNLEKVFADAWERANQADPGINFGHGILQDLFFERAKCPVFPAHCSHVITERERMIAATAIQWLGSNCGVSWLETTLKAAGYQLTRKEPAT